MSVDWMVVLVNKFHSLTRAQEIGASDLFSDDGEEVVDVFRGCATPRERRHAHHDPVRPACWTAWS